MQCDTHAHAHAHAHAHVNSDLKCCYWAICQAYPVGGGILTTNLKHPEHIKIFHEWLWPARAVHTWMQRTSSPVHVTLVCTLHSNHLHYRDQWKSSQMRSSILLYPIKFKCMLISMYQYHIQWFTEVGLDGSFPQSSSDCSTEALGNRWQ